MHFDKMQISYLHVMGWFTGLKRPNYVKVESAKKKKQLTFLHL